MSLLPSQTTHHIAPITHHVVGMKMGLISERVDVVKAGGTLTIEWSGQQDSDVLMTGPAQTVFEGEFYL